MTDTPSKIPWPDDSNPPETPSGDCGALPCSRSSVDEPERGTLAWAGKDPKLLAYRAAILINGANEDLGPLGPMNEFRMAEVIYYEVALRILSDIAKGDAPGAIEKP
jgi:hypothetical protein